MPLTSSNFQSSTTIPSWTLTALKGIFCYYFFLIKMKESPDHHHTFKAQKSDLKSLTGGGSCAVPSSKHKTTWSFILFFNLYLYFLLLISFNSLCYPTFRTCYHSVEFRPCYPSGKMFECAVLVGRVKTNSEELNAFVGWNFQLSDLHSKPGSYFSKF